jgi:hypothetical protein
MTMILNNIPDAQYLLIQQQICCILKTIQNSFEAFELNYGTAISSTIATSKMEKRQITTALQQSVQSRISQILQVGLVQ